jgi:DNA-binding winged helix-turn-helix (wHTH) protein
MVSRYQAAAEMLAAGDGLGALSQVGRDETPEGLALCGCAFAQIGDFERARRFLARAARGFGAADPVARARCVTASAEVSLALRELTGSLSGLRQASVVLSASGDLANALHARLVLARSLMFLDRRAEATQLLESVSLRGAPPLLAATTELIRAEVALRQVEIARARAALSRAQRAAERAAIPALVREVARVQEGLLAPAARLISRGHVRVLPLLEVERVLAKATWLVDGCRRELRCAARQVSFVRKPVLLELLCCLAEDWPQVVPRERLIERGFGARRSNETHRARLRVELGRLRRLLSGSGSVQAEGSGYRLVAAVSGNQGVQVLLPPSAGEHAALLALLGDGVSWPSSALAIALGASQRTLQRALLSLEESGSVVGRGQGRARRWAVAPLCALPPQLFGLLAVL